MEQRGKRSSRNEQIFFFSSAGQSTIIHPSLHNPIHNTNTNSIFRFYKPQGPIIQYLSISTPCTYAADAFASGFAISLKFLYTGKLQVLCLPGPLTSKDCKEQSIKSIASSFFCGLGSGRPEGGKGCKSSRRWPGKAMIPVALPWLPHHRK